MLSSMFTAHDLWSVVVLQLHAVTSSCKSQANISISVPHRSIIKLIGAFYSVVSYRTFNCTAQASMQFFLLLWNKIINRSIITTFPFDTVISKLMIC